MVGDSLKKLAVIRKGGNFWVCENVMDVPTMNLMKELLSRGALNSDFILERLIEMGVPEHILADLEAWLQELVPGSILLQAWVGGPVYHLPTTDSTVE